MKIAIATIAFREERFLPKFIQHYKDKVDEILVLCNQTKTWNGDPIVDDESANIARNLGATVIEYDWPSEHETLNAGLDYLNDYDWVLTIYPDEYFDNDNWQKLLEFLETCQALAIDAGGQFTYWKNGWVADPPKDYLPLIAVKPRQVRFIENRVINGNFVVSPAWVHHFAWAKTDEEIKRKLTYPEFDVVFKDKNREDWYNNKWLAWKPGDQDVHPNTPETLHDLIPAKLPPEIEVLDLWPSV